MNSFYKKWNNIAVEDWGAYTSDESKIFVDDFKNMLIRELGPEGVEVEIEPNHYECSGFLKQDDKYIFVSYSIPRGGGLIDFSNSSAFHGVLYRTAQNNRDYVGGNNYFSSLKDLPKNIKELFDNYNRE